MTNAEVLNFVELEIASRYRSLDDTVRGDWTRAIWKCGNMETARGIIREIVDDPAASLNIKQFYARLKAKSAAMAVSTSKETTAYDPLILCLEAPKDHPGWRGREWYIMGGPRNSMLECFSRSDQANKQYVADFAGGMAKAYQAAHGGQWCGVVRAADNSPYEGLLTTAQRRTDAERLILDGPDTPGRRWLLKNGKGAPILPTLKSVPPIAPPVKVASRAMLDRIAKPAELPPPYHADMTDEEFFNHESELLRAEEPPVVNVPADEDLRF